MALPVQLTNTGNPVVDATQLMTNYNWLDTGKYREAVVNGVAADGGNTAVTFSSPFANSIGVVSVTPANYSGSDNAALTFSIVGTPSLSGFTVTVGGGQTGTTVSLHYRASGS